MFNTTIPIPGMLEEGPFYIWGEGVVGLKFIKRAYYWRPSISFKKNDSTLIRDSVERFCNSKTNEKHTLVCW
jgi:hypothetical protein